MITEAIVAARCCVDMGRRWSFFLTTLALSSGCTYSATGSRNLFAYEVGCEQSVAHARHDLAPHDFACHPPPVPKDIDTADLEAAWQAFYASHRDYRCDEAPDAVVADPGRLAYWTKIRDTERAKTDDEAGDVWEVDGCKERRFYVCHYESCMPVGENPP